MELYNSHKAGLQQSNRNQINEIIQEASKGSKFYLQEQKKLEKLKNKAEIYKKKLALLNDSLHLLQLKRELDLKIEGMKDLLYNRKEEEVILHVDMDAFYAAVEALENPGYNSIPMAVGAESMLCTANYEARKFGVTSAMPGYIARKLCPHLLIVPVDFDKYHKYGLIIRNIFKDYDPNYRSYSLDEASLDTTRYLQQNSVSTTELILEIKKRILEETKLTCSIGAACTRFLAKLCSNEKKPNGHFVLPFDQQAIEAYLSELPIRKLFGVGKVTERLLVELFAIEKCHEIWEKKYQIYYIFESSFLIEAAYGVVGEGEDEQDSISRRKSISRQMSFKPTDSLDAQLRILAEATELTCEEMCALQLKGKTISLKVKTDEFEYLTRNFTIDFYTNDLSVIFRIAKSLLLEYRKKSSNSMLRLVGVGVSGLVEEDEELGTGNVLLDKFFSDSTCDTLCPICYRCLEGSEDAEVNFHIDNCLSMKEIEVILNNEFDEMSKFNEKIKSISNNESSLNNSSSSKKKSHRQLSLMNYLSGFN